jgi:hypothetical protein
VSFLQDIPVSVTEALLITVAMSIVKAGLEATDLQNTLSGSRHPFLPVLLKNIFVCAEAQILRWT